MSNYRYAAFLHKTKTVPGDQRSKEAPGHGYPEHTETWIEVVNFGSLAELHTWVGQQERLVARQKYTLVRYEELEVETMVKIKVKDE